MGEVVSIAKARQTDIFSMFDEACPSLPEETNHGVLETARRSISDGKSNKPSRFRTACLIIGTVSFCWNCTVIFRWKERRTAYDCGQ